MSSVKIRISRAALLNAFTLFFLTVSIAIVALVILCALEAHEMSRALREFRGVIEGIGYP